MKKIIWVAAALVVLGSCNKTTTSENFKVEGSVSGAEGKTLVFEASSLQGIVPLDSVKLNASGTFSFAQPRPESPEFYRLRLGNDVINFSVDSTETVRFTVAADKFATGYQVEGSENSQVIKELTLKQMEMQDKVDKLADAMNANRIPAGIYQDSVLSLVNAYKDDVKNKYIFAAPDKAYAYFALFQRVGQYSLFDPLSSRDDMRCFAAVATSLSNAYPTAERSRNLYNIVIKGMRNDRQVTSQAQGIEVPAEAVSESGLIDISLRDLHGDIHKLTDLKGKVVLLDFTAYQSDFSAAHNYELRDIYDRYHSKGLEIYQVSLDGDEHYWKTIADNLPWICVRDEAGIYSTNVQAYVVQQVPTVFLINRDGELQVRRSENQDLELTIKSLL